MTGNFFARAAVTLGVVASALAMVAGVLLILDQQILPGVLLLLSCPASLIGAFIALIRSQKNSHEIDTLSNSGRIARHVKNPPVKNVYENDASIWDQMKTSDDKR